MRPRKISASCSASTAKATRSATTPTPIPTSAKSSTQQLDLEVNLTERLFASKLGVQPLYFRPPYDIDEEPDTDDQAAPVERIQNDGYIIVGNKIDTNDWNEHPHKTPAGDHAVVLSSWRR